MLPNGKKTVTYTYKVNNLMRAIEFIIEGKGQRIYGGNQWPRMSKLIATGINRDHTLNNELAKSEDGLRQVADQLIAIDPSQGSYEPAVVTWFSNGEFFVGEDSEGITALLSQFDSLKKRKKLPQGQNDINRLTKNQTSEIVNSILQADKVAQLATQKDINNKERFARGEKANVDRGEVIIDEGGFLVLQPRTKEQAREVCRMPQGSVFANSNASIPGEPAANFCTASTNNFETYSSKGPFYTIILNDGDPAKMRVFQFQYESDQFVNESDSSVTDKEIRILSQYPGYTKFLNSMIENYYDEYL